MESRWNKYPFNSQENAEKYALEKLKKNYGIDFVYSHEWHGKTFDNEFSVYDDYPEKSQTSELLKFFGQAMKKTVFSAQVEPVIESGSKDARICKYNIYMDSTGSFRDCSHAYFFHKKITENISSILHNSKLQFTREPVIEISGLPRTIGKWNGKESLEKYLKERDFESNLYLCIAPCKSKNEYIKAIRGILQVLYKEADPLYNITVSIKNNDGKDQGNTLNGSVLFFQDLDQDGCTCEKWTDQMIAYFLEINSMN